METIKRAFPALDFHFVETTEKRNQRGDNRRQCDHLIVMRKFVTHSVQDAVRQGTHREFHLVSGGISELRGVLNEIQREASE